MLNVPKLRFREFEGEWVERKFDDIAIFSKGKGISKSDIVEDGNLECIRYGELYTVYGESIKKIKSRTNLDKDNLILSQYNDVIIPASGETQIDIATASCVLKNNVALSGDLNIIRTKENGLFLSYYLNSNKKIDIARLSQGISVVHLYSSQLKLLKLKLPKLQEQKKIAKFVTSTDQKIEELKQKRTLLESYKKGLMQKIFSQEIRFKRDDGGEFEDWVEKRLDVICKSIKSGKTKPKENGTFNVYGSTGVIGKTDKYTHKGEYILVARVGANAGLTNYINDKFSVTDNTLVISPRHELVIIKFIFLFLQQYNLNRLVFGSGQPLITGKQLKSLQLNLPSKEEQEKISNFLTIIEQKITQTTQELEQMKSFKKGMLQWMFV
jgi:type I restriction enzyme S subunit